MLEDIRDITIRISWAEYKLHELNEIIPIEEQAINVEQCYFHGFNAGMYISSVPNVVLVTVLTKARANGLPDEIAETIGQLACEAAYNDSFCVDPRVSQAPMGFRESLREGWLKDAWRAAKANLQRFVEAQKERLKASS